MEAGALDPAFDALVSCVGEAKAPAVESLIVALVGATRHLLREQSPARVTHIAKYLGGDGAEAVRFELAEARDPESLALSRRLVTTFARSASRRLAYDARYRPDDLGVAAVLFSFALATPVASRFSLRKAWERLDKDTRATLTEYQRWNAWAFSVVLKALVKKLAANPPHADTWLPRRDEALFDDFARHFAVIGTPLFALDDNEGFTRLEEAVERAQRTGDAARLLEEARFLAKTFERPASTGDHDRLRLYLAKSVSPAKT